MRRGILYFALFTAAAMLFASAGAFQLVYDRSIEKAKAEYLKGDSFNAQESFERIAAIPFSSPEARYNLGMAHILSGYKYADALSNFRQIAENESISSPLRVQAYYLMAWTIMLELLKAEAPMRPDPYNEALAYLREGLKIDASHKDSKRLYELIVHYKNLLRVPPRPANKQVEPEPGQIPRQNYEEPKP